MVPNIWRNIAVCHEHDSNSIDERFWINSVWDWDKSITLWTHSAKRMGFYGYNSVPRVFRPIKYGLPPNLTWKATMGTERFLGVNNLNPVWFLTTAVHFHHARPTHDTQTLFEDDYVKLESLHSAYAFTTSVSWRTLQLATTQLMWMMKTMTKCSPCSYDNVIPGKGKGTVCTLDIAPLRETPHQKRSGMARLCSQGISVLSAHSHVHLQLEWAIPAFAFPAIAGTHLPTPEWWKAELAWVAGYVLRQFACLRQSPIPVLTGLNVQQLRIDRDQRVIATLNCHLVTAKRLRFVYVIRRTPDLRQNWVEEIKTMSAKAPNGTAETSEQALHDATVSTVVVKRL